MVSGEMILNSTRLLLPEVILVCIASALLVAGVLAKNSSFHWVSKLSALTCIALAGLIAMLGIDQDRVLAFGGMVVRDGFSNFVAIMILLAASGAIMMARCDFAGRTMARFEYPILVLLAVAGMLLMVTANDLLILYIGVEMQSLALYVLAAFDRNTRKSPEAGMKYFILGAISSGFVLYGASLIYGYAGSTNFNLIGQALIADQDVPIGLIVGLVFLLSGLAFKISAVPFHMWTPDVYHGAPMAVTALFAMVPKLAAMALLIRVVHGAFAPVWFDAMQVLAALCIASLFVGAIGALVQTHLKRLLAYSAITNIGIILIAVIAGGGQGIGAALSYMVIYTVMGLGLFSCILMLRKGGIAVQTMDDLSGLVSHYPVMAYVMTGFLFSLSGIPPLAGFFGKLTVFQAAVEQGYTWLAVVGVVASVIAAAYYLRLIKVMLFDAAQGEGPSLLPSASLAWLIGVSALFVGFFILNPQILFTLSESAAATLFD